MLLKYVIQSAVISHYESWILWDEPLMKKIKKSKKLTKDTTEEILKNYNISRWISRDLENGEYNNYEEEFTKVVNRFTSRKGYKKLPLETKARECVDAAIFLKERIGVTRGIQVSAITKLAWFAQPDGWTMFDSQAAYSVGAMESKTRNWSCCEDFYKKLNENNFLELCKEINILLKKHSLSSLYGGRIIDKFLWIYGSPFLTADRYLLGHKQRRKNKEYPINVTNAADEAGKQLSEKFSNLLK